MPATSKSQQRLMGMVHAYNKGELGKVAPSLLKKIKTMAKSMKKKDVKDFAKTKHEDLPKKVKKSEVLNDMVKLANALDEKGLFQEADLLDHIIEDLIS
jgi:Protein of unknwon function (DUF3008)